MLIPVRDHYGSCVTNDERAFIHISHFNKFIIRKKHLNFQLRIFTNVWNDPKIPA